MKKSFLTAVATLAASMAMDASAALPESLAEQLNAKEGIMGQKNEPPNLVQNPFVLERPDSSGTPNIAEHYSHRSHASHASHASSRY
jgi:hypothetical protein